MSFGLSRQRDLDPGPIAVPPESLPPIPDDVLRDRSLAYVDPRAWFAHPERPLEIEIGSGKGTFLVQQAALQPETNFLGLEYAGEFFAYAADRLRRGQFANVRMMHTDAAELLHWRVTSACADVIHLYFPDPWPKAKHHRRRMVQDRFLIDAHRILRPGGQLRVVTDHAPYWAWMREHFDRFTAPGEGRPALFAEGPFTSPPSARDGELVGTNFERKYRENPGAGGGGTDFFATVLQRLDAPTPRHTP